MQGMDSLVLQVRFANGNTCQLRLRLFVAPPVEIVEGPAATTDPALPDFRPRLPLPHDHTQALLDPAAPTADPGKPGSPPTGPGSGGCSSAFSASCSSPCGAGSNGAAASSSPNSTAPTNRPTSGTSASKAPTTSCSATLSSTPSG
ncbi:MAG: hypothetical protein IPM98_16455 [Lewinellaceae bacterium]|nr:hypothetical protein [Lewinellaceae bacterium]